jgi:hypothetical protein
MASLHQKIKTASTSSSTQWSFMKKILPGYLLLICYWQMLSNLGLSIYPELLTFLRTSLLRLWVTIRQSYWSPVLKVLCIFAFLWQNCIYWVTMQCWLYLSFTTIFQLCFHAFNIKDYSRAFFAIKGIPFGPRAIWRYISAILKFDLAPVFLSKFFKIDLKQELCIPGQILSLCNVRCR